MKKPSGLVLFLLILGVAALWWHVKSAENMPPPAKVAKAPTAVKPAAPVLAPKPAQVEMPKVMPAVLKPAPALTVEAPKAKPVPASARDKTTKPVPTDPRVVELNVRFDEIENALNSGNIPRFFEINVAPEERRGKTVEQIAKYFVQRPDYQDLVNGYLKRLDLFRNATPDFNGDLASYTIRDPMPNKEGKVIISVISFKKVDGQWYGF